MSLIDNTKIEPYEMWDKLFNFYIIVQTQLWIPHITDTIASYEQLGFGAVGTLTDKSKFFDDEKVSFRSKND